MADNNRAVEIHSSSDDGTVVSVTAEEKEERQNNVNPWPNLKSTSKSLKKKCDLPVFDMPSNIRNTVCKLSLFQKSKGALQECSCKLLCCFSEH